MRTDDEIIALFHDRETRSSAHKGRAREVRDAYNSDLVIPTAELDEHDKPTVANLIQLGTDQSARRVSSTRPAITFLPSQNNSTQRDRARSRRSIVTDWHEQEGLQAKMRRLTRHYCAYAEAILTITPSSYDRACWRVRDPLDAFPADVEQEVSSLPDCIFRGSRTVGYLRTMYPWLAIPSRMEMPDEAAMTMLEYLDRDERVILVTWSDQDNWGGVRWRHARLSRSPIEIDYDPIVVAHRPGLSRPSGQMDGVINSYWAMAIMQSLEMIAVKRSVFNDEWFVSKEMGGVPQIVKKADGLKGITGVVAGGVPWVNTAQPGFMGAQAVDRYERAIHVGGGVPADWGGESASNVRTGRRGEQVLSAAVDFVVQEAQEAFAPMIQAADMAAIDYDRKWYGTRRKVYWMRDMKAEVRKDYDAVDLWKDGGERHSVAYAYSGSDANSLTIAIGQRLGIETMSRQTAMEIDPLVEDPEAEHDQMIAEQLERVLMQSLASQGAAGAIPPHFLGEIARMVQNDNKELFEAVDAVQKKAQEAQATPAPAGAPETQPGIAQPGAGAEQPPSVAPTGPGQRNVSSLMASLGLTQMQMAHQVPGR